MPLGVLIQSSKLSNENFVIALLFKVIVLHFKLFIYCCVVMLEFKKLWLIDKFDDDS